VRVGQLRRVPLDGVGVTPAVESDEVVSLAAPTRAVGRELLAAVRTGGGRRPAVRREPVATIDLAGGVRAATLGGVFASSAKIP
jgi:hypothetical protein